MSVQNTRLIWLKMWWPSPCCGLPRGYLTNHCWVILYVVNIMAQIWQSSHHKWDKTFEITWMCHEYTEIHRHSSWFSKLDIGNSLIDFFSVQRRPLMYEDNKRYGMKAENISIFHNSPHHVCWHFGVPDVPCVCGSERSLSEAYPNMYA